MATQTPEEYRRDLDAKMRRAYQRGFDGDRAIVDKIPLDPAEERRTRVALRTLRYSQLLGTLPGKAAER